MATHKQETWFYRGMGPDGNIVEGELVANSKEELRKTLRKKRIVLTEGKVLKSASSLSRFRISEVLSPHISLKHLARFTRQFSAMTGAGLPLMQCLDILCSQLEPLRLKKTVLVIRGDVEAGSSLSEAFGKHPKIFSELYCQMLGAGELGGVLSPILSRLAEYQEKNEKLVRKVKKALLYPLLVLSFSIVVIAVLMTWVVPIFADMFTQNGATLPLPTQMVIELSTWMERFAPLFLIFVVLGAYGIYRYYQSTSGRLMVDKFVLKIPLLGNLVKRSSVARFTRTLSTLLRSGVPLVDALTVTRKISGNKALEAGVTIAIEEIRAGQSMTEPLEKTGIFPSMSLQMMHIGEKTGELSQMLEKVADFYEEEVDGLVDSIMSLLEPLIIIFLGFFIGAILLAMYLPLFNMASQIG